MTTSVNEIGYAFLNIYYERMKKDPSKVSALYSTTAELTHINYQVDFTENNNEVQTVKLTGKENISKFFTRNNKKVCDLKVKLDSCDIQATGHSHSNIIILTTGELFWTGTPTFRFCQAFVLQRTEENENIFDITNDIIRFIPDTLRNFVAKSQDKTHAKQLKTEEAVVEEKSESIPIEQNVENKKSVDKNETSDQNNKKEQVIDKNIKETKSNGANPEELQPDPLPAKISWASKLSSIEQKVEKETSSDEQQVKSNMEKTLSHEGNRKDVASNRSSKKKQIFSTVNKDGFYPIYIRGTAGINEDKLKRILEKEFGNIMKITNADNFAVVDFENQKSQTDALERKKLKIDDVEIQLERKTVKRSTSTSPTPGSANNNSSSSSSNNGGNSNACSSRQSKKHYSEKKDHKKRDQ